MYFSHVSMLTFASKWLNLSQLRRACANLRKPRSQWYRFFLTTVPHPLVKMSHPPRTTTLLALVNLLNYQCQCHHSNPLLQRLCHLIRIWQLCSGCWDKFTGVLIAYQKLKVLVNSCSRKIKLRRERSKNTMVHWWERVMRGMLGRLVRMLKAVLSKPSNLSLTKRATKAAPESWK